MSAMDDLNKSTEEAVAAMKHAAMTIEQHGNNDPQLTAVAARLHDAAQALEAVDPAEAVAQAGSTDAQPSGTAETPSG